MLSPEIWAARQTLHALLEPSSNAKISLIRTRPDTRSGNLARTRYPQCLIEPTWAENSACRRVWAHCCRTDASRDLQQALQSRPAACCSTPLHIIAKDKHTGCPTSGGQFTAVGRPIDYDHWD